MELASTETGREGQTKKTGTGQTTGERLPALPHMIRK